MVSREDKIRTVAEWAGMWKAGQECHQLVQWLSWDGSHDHYRCSCGTEFSLWADREQSSVVPWHPAPPPNLLEPQHAWALLVAIHASDSISWYDKVHFVTEMMHPLTTNLAKSNLDRAYQLATKEQR
jgi:hypothetical protein